MSRCSVSGQLAGWVERLVRRSPTSEGGSDAHRLRAAKMMGFASAQPFLRAKTGKTREKPHFHGWRISRLGTIFAWQSSHILSNIRSRQWAKSCDLFRNQSWNGPASFAKPARTMIASSRRPIQPANVRNRTNEHRVGRGCLGASRHFFRPGAIRFVRPAGACDFQSCGLAMPITIAGFWLIATIAVPMTKPTCARGTIADNVAVDIRPTLLLSPLA
jgi:hypothetical protein